MEGVVTGTSNVLQGGSTTNSYDVNNNLAAVTDSTKTANNRTFINDAGGRILQSTQNGNTQRQLVVNGEVLGRYGSYLNPDKPADSSGNPLFITGSNFNFGYTKISGSYPAANPGTKVVAAGDTLASIAKSVYGDSTLWYLIADANGLSGDRDLRVGQTLTVPSRVTGAKNNSNSFKPYNPGEVVGNTTPNLPSPPSGGGGGCGGLGVIIMVAVAVAVTVYTGGAAAGLAGSITSFGVGALAGAAGAIASQAVGNLLGIQNGFDWNGVALAALSGGVGAGLGAAAQGTAFAGPGLGATVARAALSNALTQGVSVAVGLQKEFNWTSVAASAVGAGVGHGMNEALGLTDAAGKATTAYSGVDKVARAAFSGFAAGTATAVARGGRVEVTQIATDAFGNALGSSIGEEMVAEAEFDRISAQFDAMEEAGRKGVAFRTDRQGNVAELPGARGTRGASAMPEATRQWLSQSYAGVDNGVASDAGGGDGGPQFDAQEAAGGSNEFSLDEMRALFGGDAITGPDPAPGKSPRSSQDAGQAASGESAQWVPERPQLGSRSEYEERAAANRRYADQMRAYAAEAEKSGSSKFAAEYNRMADGYLNAAAFDQAKASNIQTHTRPMWEGVSYTPSSDLAGYRDPTLARADRVAGIGYSQGRGILPDYQSLSVGAHTLTGAVSTNFYDGTIAYGGGVQATNIDPGFRPSASYSLGWIFGVNDAKGVTDFITGSGTQIGVAIPTPWKLSPSIVINHSYGGKWALELGVTPGTPKTVLVYQPYGYATEKEK